jgi:membrane-bound serine protease (ClpP class)
MELLFDPNVAYLLLAGGFMLAILALLSPGTGLLEIGALITLTLAVISVSQMPINLWALLILLIGVFPFFLAVRRSGRLLYLGISIVALVIGSAFLFRSSVWYLPAVNPILALVVSAVSASFLWVATTKILEAEGIKPTHDLGALIGAVGEARTDIQAQGSVQVAGELWSAFSAQRIPTGTPVRVIGREGFMLEVEPLRQPAPLDPQNDQSAA